MRLNRQQFVERYFHTLLGLLLDGALSRRCGGELSLWLRACQREVADLLSRAYADLNPPLHSAPKETQP
jgi:hypothetical protein